MVVTGGHSRRATDLDPEDAEIASWAHDGYPPALQPLIDRLERTRIWTLNVNQGWWPLVARTDAEIAAINPSYRIARIGEEMGVLEFEIVPDDLTEVIENVLDGARSESTRTCEICADRGRAYRQGDWLITLCVDHARARGARPAKTDRDIADAVPRAPDREMAFALSADIPASAFTPRARRENEAYLRASAEADERELALWMTTAEVARLICRTPAEVNKLRKQNALYAGRRRTGRYAFPRWQFDQQDRPLVGLRRIIPALSDEHPLSAYVIMTEPLRSWTTFRPRSGWHNADPLKPSWASSRRSVLYEHGRWAPTRRHL